MKVDEVAVLVLGVFKNFLTLEGALQFRIYQQFRQCSPESTVT